MKYDLRRGRSKVSSAGQVATVRPGSEVRIQVGQDEETWTVVAHHETDPMANRISELSPLGCALLGHRVGDTVAVKGPWQYRATILDVR